MQNFTATSSNLVMFVPKLTASANEGWRLAPSRGTKVIEMDSAARARATAKKRAPMFWTLDPNDLTAA